MAKLEAMHTFVKVAETSSFAEAARQLHMSPPAVTRAVSALEEQIGTRLFTRTTRVVRLTEAGNRYFEDCRKILADVEEAEAAASGSYARPTGVLHVTASVLFGQQFLLPILTEFLGENPDVTVRSLFVDRVVNLVDEGIDVAIRIGHLPDSSQSAVRVGKVRQVVCGAPSYFADHGIPQQPADLARHRMIAGTSSFSSLDWFFGQDQKHKVHITPRLFCNTYDSVIRATLEGWGLSRVLSYQIGEHLVEGRLQTVLSDFEQDPLPIHIVHPEGRRASAKVRAFIDLAVDRLRANRLIN
ncbi:LysR family transcriptional regulator [Sphingorhabdus lacus]|uniref:LysR family transcriptional regulator n=1 Tax=Sphingorhabdus lacus TaxID=392610 RepID=A0A6I6LHZ5_9SPHN|nr:LysR family transcriptional regulator [Sphingorhabdus lacus]QGY81983.1 LysR family transcriptional regulator [Sphingorhabdus lacus]